MNDISAMWVLGVGSLACQTLIAQSNVWCARRAGVKQHNFIYRLPESGKRLHLKSLHGGVVRQLNADSIT